MRPRKIAHVAQRSTPTRSPKPRSATTPHACQSQSPAQVFTDVKARGDGNEEGSEVEMVEEVDIKVDEDMDVEVDDVDWLLTLVVDTPVLLVDDEDEVDAIEFELVVVVVAVTNSDLVVLTLVSVVQIATPSPSVVVVIVLSTVIPNSL